MKRLSRKLAGLLLGVLLFALASATTEREARATVVPTSITFTFNAPEYNYGDYVWFYVNGTNVYFNFVWAQQVVTFTDPAVLALLDPAGCNTFGVSYVCDDTGYCAWLQIAVVRVDVTTSNGGRFSSCLWDGYPGNPNATCADRPYWEGAGYSPADYFGGGFIGGPDVDGDGLVGGIGPTCADNCSGAYNPDQTDTDHDGWGDVCDTCPGLSNPGPVGQLDSDYDGVGNVCDNCPSAKNASQNDANHNGLGDACDPVCATVNDVADTFIVANHAPNGSAVTLVSDPLRQALLAFNLASIPASAQVVSGQLNFFQLGTAGGINPLTISTAQTSWAEATATWETFGAPNNGNLIGQGNNRSGSGAFSIPLTASFPLSDIQNGVVVTQAAGTTYVYSRELGSANGRPTLKLCYVIPG